MLARARQLQARAFPHGFADAARQVAIFAAAYYSYRLVRGQADTRAASAFEHARDVINLERGLHVFVEPALQSWTSGSDVLIDAASWLYLNAQFTITIGALVWLYLFRNRSFYFVRNMMVVSMGIALIGYIAFPTAPPRFLPEWGFTDSVANFTGVRSDSLAVDALFNPYAAIPSMHVAYALMIGLPIARLVRWRALRVFWTAYPLLVTFVIVATANHFLTDAFLGAVTAAVAGSTAWSLARARPAAWAFAPAT
jgi:hypothetical protein